jgi:predicted secreted hydrolase
MKQMTILVLSAITLATQPVLASDTQNLCATHPSHAGAAVSIPADDAVHLGSDGLPTVAYDQWYWNAVLLGTDGHSYGVETIPFQFNFPIIGVFDVTQIAIADTTAGTYQSQLIFGAPGTQYTYVPNAIAISITDGTDTFTAVGGNGTDNLTLKYADGTVVQLHFEATKNPAPAWNDGIGVMVDPVTGTSHGTQYYYNRRNMATYGTIMKPGDAPVFAAGAGWYDREFGTVIGTPGTQANDVNWRWSSLHLSDDSDYMLWDMYADDTGNNLLHYVNEIGAAPACTESTITAFTFTPSSTTVFNAGPPASNLNVGGHLSIPAEDLEVEITPITSNQIINTGGIFSPFFEASATIVGTKHGRPIAGVGYYEEFVSNGAAGGCCQEVVP